MNTWQEKQPILYDLLGKVLKKERLAHAYLFDGANGLGKKEAAIWLVQSCFCTQKNEGKPCGICNSCLRVFNHEHPDVYFIEPETSVIKVEQIRALQEEFSKSSMEGGYKAFVIFEADKLNISSGNSLLKFLEEPNPKTLAILTTTNQAKILPTILSRVQTFTLHPLGKEQLAQELIKQNIAKTLAIDLAELSNNIEELIEKAGDELFFERRKSIYKLFEYMRNADLNAFIYVQKSIMKHLNHKDIKDEQKRKIQNETLDLLQVLCQREMKNSFATINASQNYAKMSDEIIKARLKLASNVSFQNTLEQLTLKCIQLFKIKR
ncbi:MAG: DNA polymerase III subunit delta' [Streptococcaceae bacterium]|jgi:DNA polymerase-3 subunit delta'|nr:DNA polymerase III subunit delta' [Streptococcaceae bacterium]